MILRIKSKLGESEYANLSCKDIRNKINCLSGKYDIVTYTDYIIHGRGIRRSAEKIIIIEIKGEKKNVKSNCTK